MILSLGGAVILLSASRYARAGVSASPHDFSTTRPAGYLHNSARLAPGGVCSACHVPHGALDNVLWPRSLADYRGKLYRRDGASPSTEPNFLLPPALECYDCHDLHQAGASIELTSVPELAWFDPAHRPQDILSGFTKTAPGSMTEDGFGGDVSGYFETSPPGPSTDYGVDLAATQDRTGGHYFKQDPTMASDDAYDNGDKLPCRDCHDPHAWNADWQAFIRAGLGGATGWSRVSAGKPIASTYMANAVPGGASSRNDPKSRELCVACHGTSDTLQPVNFTDVSARYTRIAPIARPPATLPEHAGTSPAPCVACHSHNAIAANCSRCHGFPPAPYPPARASAPPPAYTQRDPHAQHVGREDGQPAGSFPGSAYRYDCKVCHAYSAMGSRTPPNHADNVINIDFDLSAFGVPDPPSAVRPANGGLPCANVYCHSNGGSDNNAAVTGGYYTPVQWGVSASPLRCNRCHGADKAGLVGTPDNAVDTGMPNYPSGAGGSATANSHGAHVTNNRYDCSVCHFDTAQGNYVVGRTIKTSPFRHLNGARDVVFDGAAAVGGPTPYTGGTEKRCAVSCHNSQNLPLAQQPQWGNPSSATCAACHLGAADADQYLDGTDAWYRNNAVAVLDNGEWAWSGHGRAAGSYDVSGRPAAALLSGGTGNNPCVYCHNPDVGHKESANPFRLRDQSGVPGYSAAGWNATCLVCHSVTPVPPGYDPDGDNNATYARRTAVAAFADNAHLGEKHTTGNGGKFCWDCHDPHGDRRPGGPGNIFMVQAGRLPVRTDGTFGFPGTTGALTANAPVFVDNAAGTGYADNSTFRGICQVCHAATRHYTASSGDGHGAGARCTSCHPHGRQFVPIECMDCHGGVDGSIPGRFGAPVITRYWQTSGHGNSRISRACEDCHDVGSPPGRHAADNTGTLDTLNWPGKPADTRSANTSHLKPFFFPVSPVDNADYAHAFDEGCANVTGCHRTASGARNARDMRHARGTLPTRFGNNKTTIIPKSYTWYTQGLYADQFYRSQSPWVIGDLDNNAGGGVQYGVCVSCHDPHGTGATDNVGGGDTRNVMVRGNWKTEMGAFCTGACHRQP